MKNKISGLIGYIFALWIIVLIFLALIAGTKALVNMVFETKNTSTATVETEDYIVSAGETLWSIACENKKEKQDVREYVYQLRQLNNIDDCIIVPGQTIKIIK